MKSQNRIPAGKPAIERKTARPLAVRSTLRAGNPAEFPWQVSVRTSKG